jgi:hypothetical protein
MAANNTGCSFSPAEFGTRLRLLLCKAHSLLYIIIAVLVWMCNATDAVAATVLEVLMILILGTFVYKIRRIDMTCIMGFDIFWIFCVV